MYRSIADADNFGEKKSYRQDPESQVARPTAWDLFAAAIIPTAGATFYTHSGPAKTFARIYLAPGDGLSKRHRALAEAHPLVQCSIRGDSGPTCPAPSPDEFHRTTVRWALKRADHIAIWSAPFPEMVDENATWSIDAVDAGARFITTIETTRDRAVDWSQLVDRWRRPKAQVRVFGPVGPEMTWEATLAALFDGNEGDAR